MLSEKTKSFFGVFLIFIFFILSSYAVRTNLDFFREVVGIGYLGSLIYILIIIFAIVVAPISAMPLMPVASNIYGWFYGAVFTIVGWTLGSFVVFFLCRKYGIDLVKKFVSLKSIYKIESKIPKGEVFFDILLLRMIVPVDILSYALSLFTKVKFRTYAITTIIGITPFAFVWSYLGVIPLIYQILGITAIVLLITLVHLLRELAKDSKKVGKKFYK